MDFSITALLPELVLAIGALALLMVGVFGGERSVPLVSWLSVAVIVLAALALLAQPSSTTVFGGSLIVDPFARLMKLFILVGSAAAIVMSVGYLRAQKIERFEYPVLIVIATLGMLLMVSANDLIALYLGLEMHSLALYVLAAINRDSVKSTEAGLKYFVLGALASGMLLYGASLIYGFTGQTTFAGIASVLTAGGESHLGLVFGIVFLIAGLAFKVSAVPFHMWTPDVYEGAPTPVTAFLAVAPKIAALALFVRAIVAPFPTVVHDWQQIIAFIAIASMVLGAFGGIGQRNFKRLMAYSAIGHMGYALVGLAAGTADGVRGVILYIVIYGAMTLGTFAVIVAMRRSEGPVENIDDLAGLSRSHPVQAFLLAALLFALAGIPPLSGFFAKFYVFLAAVQSGLYLLAVIGVLASVVGAYYYLRVVRIIYFDEPAERLQPMAPELRVVLGLSGLFTVLYVFFAGPIAGVAEVAAKSLF